MRLRAASTLAQRKTPEPKTREEWGRLAMFPGTPVILVESKGEGPVAFVLAKNGKTIQGRESKWFGKTITWFDQEKLGWRLGVE